MNVCVVTIDIQKSRKLQDRAKVQLKTLGLLQMLNEKFSDNLIAKFTMTLGDEFQGVLKKPSDALAIYNITRRVLPVKIYCGIGVGALNTPISANPSEMDGPAFYNSREALEEAKREKTELVVKTEDEELNEIVNTIIQLILHAKSKQTAKQKSIITYMEQYPNITQVKVAQQLGISKQAVSKSLKLAGWEKVKRAENLVKELLESKLRNVDKLKSTIRG